MKSWGFLSYGAQLVKAEQIGQIGVVGLPVIVTHHASGQRDYSDLVHGIGATLFMGETVCIGQVRGTMQSMTLAIDVDTRFIDAHQCRCRQLRLDPLLEQLQRVERLFVEVDNGARAEWNLHLVDEVITDPIIRDQLELGPHRPHES